MLIRASPALWGSHSNQRRIIPFLLRIVRIVTFYCFPVQVCDVMAAMGLVYAVPSTTFLLEER